MTLNVTGILDGIISHAMATGLFEQVNGHEPKSAPTSNGLTVAVWADRVDPVPAGSGLAATSARVVFNVRIYSSMLQQPMDAIDPNILAALGVLMGAYSGDFDLGTTIRNVDLLGQAGIPLSAQAGYINQDGKLMRVMTIVLPTLINDVWDQVA